MTAVVDDELSPLQAIEATVQEQARSLAAGAVDEADLRRLVTEAVGQWSLDHRRGARPYDLADPDEVIERAVRNLAGYGPLAPLLADDDVWEVMINAPAEIFVKRHRGPSGYHHEVFHDDAHVIRTLTKVLEDSSSSHRKLDATEGLQDAQLDDGSRLHIVHGDIGRGGHVMVNIRKFTDVAFHDLGELVQRDMLSNDAARFLATCVQAKASIVFAGAPGSGKTTMLSCCCAELDPTLRVVVAEEVFEADVPVANMRLPPHTPRRTSDSDGSPKVVGEPRPVGASSGEHLGDLVPLPGRGRFQRQLLLVHASQGYDRPEISGFSMDLAM